MEKKLIGFKRFRSKKGNDVCVAHIATKFTPQQEANGAYGCAVESLFLPPDQYDYLRPDDLGKEVITDYDIVGRQAYLRTLTVVRAKSAKAE